MQAPHAHPTAAAQKSPPGRKAQGVNHALAAMHGETTGKGGQAPTNRMKVPQQTIHLEGPTHANHSTYRDHPQHRHSRMADHRRKLGHYDTTRKHCVHRGSSTLRLANAANVGASNAPCDRAIAGLCGCIGPSTRTLGRALDSACTTTQRVFASASITCERCTADVTASGVVWLGVVISNPLLIDRRGGLRGSGRQVRQVWPKFPEVVRAQINSPDNAISNLFKLHTSGRWDRLFSSDPSRHHRLCNAEFFSQLNAAYLGISNVFGEVHAPTIAQSYVTCNSQ